MPCYNSESTIQRAVDSILSQTYKNWELLITDDNSSDNTVAHINEYLNCDRIKLFRLKKNSGAGIARNISISNAKGRFIAFCDSDDYWIKEKLELQVPFMLNNSLGLSYTDYFIDSGNNIPMKRVNCLPEIKFNDLVRTNYIGCLTAVYDTEIVGKVFMESVRKRQDWILWLELLKKMEKAMGLNIPLSVYDGSNQSLSSNKLKLIRSTWYVYREYLNYNSIRSLYCLLIFTISYIKKSKYTMS